MGIFDKLRDKVDEIGDKVKDAVEDTVTGPIRGTEALLEGNFEEALEAYADSVTFGQGKEALDLNMTLVTGGLNKVKESRDKAKAAEEAEKAAAEASEEEIRKKQAQLRRLEFDKAIGEQTEAAQLAQRTLFRQSSQATTQAQAQRASTANIAAQLGTTETSATQSTLASSRTQSNITQSDIQTDQARLSKNLGENLEFLADTFELGGDINAASQRLASQQAAIEDRARQRANTLQGAGTGATLASLAGGGPMAVVGSAFLGGAIGGDLSFEDIFSF